MKDVEYIVGVYNSINANPVIGTPQAFYLLYLLDEKGMLELEAAQKIYLESFKPEMSMDELLVDFNKSKIGPFESLEKLNQFAFQLCEVLNASKVSLLSVSEYNTFLENAQNASDFHKDLLEKGNVMENIDRKKKGFFSRIFN